jgi:hypothetical protein
MVGVTAAMQACWVHAGAHSSALATVAAAVGCLGVAGSGLAGWPHLALLVCTFQQELICLSARQVDFFKKIYTFFIEK